MPFGKVDTEPVYLTQMKDLLKRHPKTHDHLGPHRPRADRPSRAGVGGGRRAPPTHLEILDGMLTDPSLRHVDFDISWDEVAKYAVSSPEVDRARGHASSTSTPTDSSSAPTPSRRPARSRTTRSSTCGLRFGSG